MQVGRGGTQVEGVSYVHRILAVITPHSARGNLSRSLRLHLPAHRFISGQPQACTAHSPILLDDDDDDSDREAVWTPVIKVEASPVKFCLEMD